MVNDSILTTKGGKAVTVRTEQNSREALAVLARHNSGALIVADAAGKPVGILSERDIVREAAKNEAVFARRVGDLMTRDVIMGQPHDDLQAVANTMTEKRIRHLPVMDKGKLVGIVSIGDGGKAQRDHYRGEAR